MTLERERRDITDSSSEVDLEEGEIAVIDTDETAGDDEEEVKDLVDFANKVERGHIVGDVDKTVDGVYADEEEKPEEGEE